MCRPWTCFISVIFFGLKIGKLRFCLGQRGIVEAAGSEIAMTFYSLLPSSCCYKGLLLMKSPREACVLHHQRLFFSILLGLLPGSQPNKHICRRSLQVFDSLLVWMRSLTTELYCSYLLPTVHYVEK